MKGFKALNKDMTSKWGNMTYELGQKYGNYNNPVNICDYGFHFCKKLWQVQSFYDLSESRVFEIDTLDGVIKEEYGKVISSQIQLVRELTRTEILDIVEQGLLENSIDAKFIFLALRLKLQNYSKNPKIQKILDYEKLYTHIHWKIREELANQGYKLDQLIHDKDPDVRIAVARQNYGLNVLRNDTDVYVRGVAKSQIIKLNQ